MVCLPLIERELRVALRKHRPVWSRFKVAALAAGLSTVFLLVAAFTGDNFAGASLELALFLAGLYFVVRAPGLTAGVLAEERRNQTLGLLFLSGLGPWEVFAGKFLSATLVVFTNLLAIFPTLALPFLIGGVSYDVFLAIIGTLPALMLFTLAVSLVGSVLSEDEGVALVLAIEIAALLCLAGPAVYLGEPYLSPGITPSLGWLRISPAYAPCLIAHGLARGWHPGDAAEVWQNLALTMGWTVTALLTAGLVLKRIWRIREEEEFMGGWRKRWREFMRGNPAHRARWAQRWFRVNPFVWYVGRNRQQVMLGWLLTGGMAALWLLGLAVFRKRWLDVRGMFLMAILLNTVLGWLTRFAAAEAMGHARRDGICELLLTTPLRPREIVRGTIEGLRRQFGPLAKFILLLNVTMMVLTFATRQLNRGEVVECGLIWLLLLGWTWNFGHQWGRVLPIMWVSLNSGRPAFAVWRTSGGTKAFYWMVFNLMILGSLAPRFPGGSGFEVIFVSFFALFLLIWQAVHGLLRLRERRMGKFDYDPTAVDFMMTAEGYFGNRLIREFREIAREPIPDPGDRRFKRWNLRERFPWGWEMAQQQLHERLARW